jgi:type III pantothenate kinase
VVHVVADIGNSRLKWGRVDETGRLTEMVALPLDETPAWVAAWQKWSDQGSSLTSWAISSVNPPVAKGLRTFFGWMGVTSATWFCSAADVAVRHELTEPESAGADRALAVAAAIGLAPPGRPGLVVSCGTAITVERVSEQGIWLGGAIAPGLRVAASALHNQTARLPWVKPQDAPRSWGASTQPAVEAGVFWGTVGAVRELLSRQVADMGHEPWVIWTGGDAALIAGAIAGNEARIEPDLVLLGLLMTHVKTARRL